VISVDTLFPKLGLDVRGVTPLDRYLEKARSISNQIGIKNRYRVALANGWEQVAAVLFQDLGY
jgi:hypothetical protein